MRSSVLSDRDFVKLWAGQGVSVFGSLISRAVLPFIVVFTLHGSNMSVAWLRVAELVPGILLGLVAGAMVDRARRRTVMIVVDIARGLLMAAIPVLFITGRLNLLFILVVALLMSVATAGFDSAYDAYLPTLVPEDQLLDANSKLSAVASVAEVAGFGLAGALFQWVGGALTVSFDALSFVVSAVSVVLIKRPEPPVPPVEDREPVLREIRAGVHVLRRSGPLRRMAMLACVQSVYFGISGAVYVLFLSRVLHMAPGLQGILYAVGGAASFGTAALAGRLSVRFGHRRYLIMAAVLGLIGAALLPAAYGSIGLLVVFVVGQQLLGDGGDTLLDIGLASLRQQYTANAYLGRVSAAWFVLTGIGTLGGTLAGGLLAGGLLAGAIGLRDALIVGVGVRLVVVALTLLKDRGAVEAAAASG